MPKEDKTQKKKELVEKEVLIDSTEDTFLDDEIGPQIPTSINEELQDLVDDNPNKLIGCGG